MKGVKLIAPVVETYGLYSRLSASVDKLLILKRMMVPPSVFEVFKTASVYDSHSATDRKFFSVRTFRSSHPELSSHLRNPAQKACS